MSAFSHSSYVGLITNLPSILATRTSAIGSRIGTSDTLRAHEAARPAYASGIVSLSAERRYTFTKVSE